MRCRLSSGNNRYLSFYLIGSYSRQLFLSHPVSSEYRPVESWLKKSAMSRYALVNSRYRYIHFPFIFMLVSSTCQLNLALGFQYRLNRWRITLDPAIYVTVINIDTAFTEHLFELSIADPVFTIPTYSPNNNVVGKLSILKEFHEIASLKQKRSLAESTIFETEPECSCLI